MSNVTENEHHNGESVQEWEIIWLESPRDGFW